MLVTRVDRRAAQARSRRQPRYGRQPRSSSIPASRAIQHRPTEVEDRKTFGHWEADLLIFRREHGKANLTSMLERQTRYTILLPNPDRQSNALDVKATNRPSGEMIGS